jgi:hypothetical protein
MYRCRAGHVYSADSLLAVQGEDLDSAIWRPIRMLHERGALLRRLSARAASQGRERSARYFDEQAQEALRRAHEARIALTSPEPRPAPGVERAAARLVGAPPEQAQPPEIGTPRR